MNRISNMHNLTKKLLEKEKQQMAKTIPAHVNLHWHCKVRQDSLLDPRDFDAFELNNIPWDDHSVLFFVMTHENYGPAYAKTVEEKIKLLLRVKAKSALRMDAYFIWPGKWSSDLFYINRASIDTILRKLGYLTDEEKAKALQTEYREALLQLKKAEFQLHGAIRDTNALKVRISKLDKRLKIIDKDKMARAFNLYKEASQDIYDEEIIPEDDQSESDYNRGNFNSEYSGYPAQEDFG